MGIPLIAVIVVRSLSRQSAFPTGPIKKPDEQEPLNLCSANKNPRHTLGRGQQRKKQDRRVLTPQIAKLVRKVNSQPLQMVRQRRAGKKMLRRRKASEAGIGA